MWWESAVLYQVYPRSYADSNADGDRRSARAHLEARPPRVARGRRACGSARRSRRRTTTGATTSPTTATSIRRLGTLADLERLIVEAERRDLRVLLDLVPNHTSDAHPWFHDAEKRRLVRLARPEAGRVAAEQLEVGVRRRRRGRSIRRAVSTTCTTSCPSSPTSTGGTRTCARRSTTSSRFWFERGVAGFRIDVAHALVKDPQLRDNPPPRPSEGRRRRGSGSGRGTTWGCPEAVDVHRRLRSVAREFEPERLLLGETYVLELEKLHAVHRAGRPPALHEPRVPARAVRGRASSRTSSRDTEALMPDGATPRLARVEPRRPALRDALVQRRRAGDPLRARRAPLAARRVHSLPGRRDRARGGAGSAASASATWSAAIRAGRR